MSDESSSDDEGTNILGGFMFGNIDKEGQLETNIFGDVSLAHFIKVMICFLIPQKL